MRIGILTAHAKAEAKKDELVLVTSTKRPWARLAPQHLTIKRNKKNFIPGDVCIGCYIMYTYPHIEVDFIQPHEISVKRLHSNDLNFVLIYDLLESFHTDKNSVYQKFKDTLKRAKNVYPPYYFQKFINNKCSYYKYLEKKKQQVVPTFCITRKKWKTRQEKVRYVQGILDKIKHNKWEQFIAKPVLGQESLDFKKFKTLRFEPLMHYVSRVIDKYPAIVFQEYIKGFDKENPETRMYYVGNRYQFSIITTKTKVGRPKSEGGNIKLPLDTRKKFANRVLKKLPPIIIQGVKLPKLLTRIDIGCCLEGKQPLFVNEIEFVPSLYIEDHPFLIDAQLGKQMVLITKHFLKNV